MPAPTVPDQPRHGDICVVCIHGLVEPVHFFFVPPLEENPRHGFYGVRPDGSRCGPVRWIIMCPNCFPRYRHNAFTCPCSDDFIWPEESPFTIRREHGVGS